MTDSFEVKHLSRSDVERGIGMGRFIGELHLLKPLSDKPRIDALEEVGVTAYLMTTNGMTVDDVDQLVMGLVGGVQEVFTEQQGVAS